MPHATELETYLHQNIPLSAAMGVRVKSAGSGGIRLWVPLAPNVNHQSTAFGGSISTLATLAAWAHVNELLIEHCVPATLVIQDNSVEYLKPVLGDFEATSGPIDGQDWERFFKTFHEHRKARLTVPADVRSDGAVCAHFSGRFVAIPRE